MQHILRKVFLTCLATEKKRYFYYPERGQYYLNVKEPSHFAVNPKIYSFLVTLVLIIVNSACFLCLVLIHIILVK